MASPVDACNGRTSQWASESTLPTEAAWEEQRSYIEHLYEKLPLKTVMKKMENERGFKATARMYKVRLKKWRVKKNYDKSEVEDILHEYRVKKNFQRDPVIERRGKIVDPTRVRRFLKNGGSKVSSPGLPLQKLSPDSTCGHNLKFVCTPEAFLIPEKLLWTIDGYFKGSFGNGTWLSGSDAEPCYSVKKGSSGSFQDVFRRSLRMAFDLFQTGDLRGTEKTWASISTMLSNLVKSEDVRNWCLFCGVAIDLTRLGWFKIAREILKQSSVLAAVYHGVEHPLHQLCKYLSTMSPSELGYNADINWRKANDTLAEILGEMHITVLLERSRMLGSLEISDVTCKFDIMETLIRKCEKSCSFPDPRTLQMRIHHVVLLNEDGQKIEALNKAELVLRQLDKVPFSLMGESSWSGLRYDAHWITGRLYSALRQMDLAEYHCREALRTALSTWGKWDSRALCPLVDLEQILLQAGRREQAASIRTQRLKAQEEQITVP